ncbi:MAG: ABC transporter permease [Actinomycetota bacterium]|nr:ABC transporter permease [Actinomycetota bacterium]
MNFLSYLASRWDALLADAIAHAQVVLLSLGIATVIGVTLGVLVYRRDFLAQAVLAVASVALTVPSFALFGLLIPIFGLGYKPTVVALTNYALLPVLRNTITGLQGVDPAITESAKGMGLSNFQRLVRIELPLAWPVIIAGIRTSGLLILGIAAIAAYVNGPGLGGDIFMGLARVGGANALNLVLGGFLGIMVLALLFDLFIGIVGKLTTSRGL